MNFEQMKAKIAAGDGFIAALDQSGGSTPKALAGYGVGEDEYSGEDEMFAKIHEMRCRIVESPAFTGDKVVGAILFEKTMEGCNPEGMPIPERLAGKGIVPFLKVDKGMHDEANGVQLMKDIPGLDELRIGAGVGVRYETNFGPIRVDVGVPLNRREGDSPVAVYVGLGQAF
mgnify:CR=1 FL=1